MVLFYPQLFETINNSQPVLFQTFEQLRFPRCVFCAKFDIDNSKTDYGELERVSGELDHPRALPHLHKQVNKTTYIQNVCAIYPIYSICPTHLVHPMMVCHTYPQTGAGLAKLSGPSLSSPALSHTCKKIQILTKTTLATQLEEA